MPPEYTEGFQDLVTLLERCYVPAYGSGLLSEIKGKIYHWQTVKSSEEPSMWPVFSGLQSRPNLKQVRERISFPYPKGRSYPSFSWPTSSMSGRHTPSFSGSLGCFVRSKMNTDPFTALLAMRSGFWGMYRARLTSPSWLIF